MSNTVGQQSLHGFPEPLTGYFLRDAQRKVRESHYTHSIPSGKSYWWELDGAVICFSIPANKNIGKFLLGRDCVCWELSRLWAKDGHAHNLLTRISSDGVLEFSRLEPRCEVLVSYADPNAEHSGGVYKAASWIFTGRSEETRYYTDSDGQTVARRKFHSGDRFLLKQEIEDLGYTEHKRPGKLRFARGISRRARKELCIRFP